MSTMLLCTKVLATHVTQFVKTRHNGAYEGAYYLPVILGIMAWLDDNSLMCLFLYL